MVGLAVAYHSNGDIAVREWRQTVELRGIAVNLTVELPAEIVAELDAASISVLERARQLGGFADVAAYVALFSGQAATLVTLIDAPRVLRMVVEAIAGRRHRSTDHLWLNVRGPGGTASLELTEPLDSDVLYGLAAAIWQIDSPK